jgi:hypothetical protein
MGKGKNQSSCPGLERSPTIVIKDKPVEYKKKKKEIRTEGIDHYHHHHHHE